MDEKTLKMIAVVAVVVGLGYVLFGSGGSSTSGKREYISYPFHPIDPMNVNPVEAQAVFGQPSYMFQLSSSPETAPFGAYQALQAAQNLVALDQAMGIDWQTNQGFNATGNADYNLMLSQEPIGSWKNL